MKPYPKPKKREKKKRKRIKYFSEKRQGLEDEYKILKKEFLKDNANCKRCGAKATDLHHIQKRLGKLLIDPANFMALCRICHTWVHDNSKEAKEQGYIIKVK